MKILVAGIGNIFEGDDAFGCEVTKTLARRTLPAEVHLDLTYALMDNPHLAILIDATPRGNAPGTLYTIEPEFDRNTSPEALEAHAMNPVSVLRAARAMGAQPGRVLLLGCEPGDLGGEDGRMGLTPPVAAALEEAADMVEELIQNELKEILV